MNNYESIKKIGRFFTYYDAKNFIATNSDGGFVKFNVMEENPLIMAENVLADEIEAILDFYKNSKEDIFAAPAIS